MTHSLRRLAAGIALASLAFSLPAIAENAAERLGPPVGSALPFTLSLADETGEMRTLDDLAGPNGTVLVYVRSLDWCPFCKGQMAELIENASAFQERGYGLASVSYDSPQKLNRFAAQYQIDRDAVALLSDPDSATIDALGIRNEEHEQGSAAYGIPHPIVLAVTPDGIIAAKFARDGYRDRPELNEILTGLDRLSGDGT